MIELAEIVREHPEAVFVRKTNLSSVEERAGFREAGYAIARDLLAEHAPQDKTFVLKPNVVTALLRDRHTGELVNGARGIVTDVDFVEGIVRRLLETGARVVVAEGGGEIPMDPVFEGRGYTQMAARMGIPLLDLNRQAGTYPDDMLNWTPVEGGFFTEIPFVRPINDPDTILINIPTMKTHNLAVVSLCAKNLQGTVALGYRHFCSCLESTLLYVPDALDHYRPDLLRSLVVNFERHCQEGYPLWSRERLVYEAYAQRTCDLVQAVNCSFNIVEGIIGRDGTAFHHGKDILANLIVAGVNIIHVDTITSYLMGHDPRNIGYLKLANERELGTNDPEQIPVYMLGKEGEVTACHPSEIGRLALGVYYRGDTSRYVFF